MDCGLEIQQFSFTFASQEMAKKSCQCLGSTYAKTMLTGIEVSRFPAKPAPAPQHTKVSKMVKMNLQLGRAESGRRRYNSIVK